MQWFERVIGNFLNRFSMKQRILFIVLFPSLLFIVDSYVEFKDVAGEGEKGEMRIVETLASEIKSLIAIEYYERYRDMKSLALNEVLLSNNKSNIEDTLNKFVQLYYDYDVIVFTDLMGRAVAVNTEDNKGKTINYKELYKKDYSKTGWYKNVMEGKYTEDHAKGFKGVYFKDAYVDHKLNKLIGKKDHLVNSFSTMVYGKDGSPVGLLHGKTNFHWVEAELLHVYNNTLKHGLKTIHISLFNKDGQLIADLDGHNSGTGNEDDLFQRDFTKYILKTSIEDYGDDFIKLSENHKSYAQYTYNKKKDLSQVVAYAPLEDEKFIDAIGWQIFTKVDSDELMGALYAAERRFIVGLVSVSVFAVLFALVIARIFNKELEGTVLTLTSGSEQLSESIMQLSQSTENLGSTMEQQSSAAQETSAAIHEISSMSQKNVQKVSEAQDLGKDCLSASKQADKYTDSLKDSMNLMKESNSGLEKSVEETLKEMETLVESVNEIAQKTNLINEIVFQTKLLSFNASVEAARAGENGKGFAVVAEEIGQLANTSGKASSEISDIVEKSLSRVSSMVENSRNTLKQSLSDAEKVTSESYDSALETAEQLGLISSKIQELEQIINQVSAASQEQEKGVEEVNKALSQIALGTQQVQGEVTSNTQLTSQFNNLVEELNNSSQSMKELVEGAKKAA